MILTDAHDALAAIDPNVFYGTAAQLEKRAKWDYIVLSRDVLRRKENRSGYSDVLNVVIVREEFIPDGLPEQVIEVMEALAGVRLMEGAHEYAYAVKPATTMTCEQLVLKFTHSRKK